MLLQSKLGIGGPEKMASEYIDRQAEISEILGQPPEAHYPAWYAEQVKALPPADVRPVVRGRWEPSEKFKGYVSCSICHDCYVELEWVTKMKWNYCPHCGADMREDDE